MYLRAVHAESEILLLRKFIRDNPLGILITGLKSSRFPALQCTHIPWVLDVADEDSKTELGRLRGHLARANPHAKALSEAAETGGPVLESEVTVLFNGPAHHYVTPKFYTQTKPDTGKVVPTWNYSAAQVYGKARIHFDAKSPTTSSFLQQQITDLTKHSEEHVMNYSGNNGNMSAWEVTDAPNSFIDLLKKAIIGIEIDIDRLEGKYKMSQEMGVEDRQGVINGFKSLDTEVGQKIAETVERRGQLHDEKQDDKQRASL